MVDSSAVAGTLGEAASATPATLRLALPVAMMSSQKRSLRFATISERLNDDLREVWRDRFHDRGRV